MALAKLRDFNPATDGTFIAPVPLLEQLGATRALITTDDGVCQGYAHPDTRLWPGPLVTPTPAKVAADAAAAAAAAAAITADNTRAAQAAAFLAKLEDGTATLADLRVGLAKLVRYLNAQNPRGG
jgi:hypothetical protein